MKYETDGLCFCVVIVQLGSSDGERADNDETDGGDDRTIMEGSEVAVTAMVAVRKNGMEDVDEKCNRYTNRRCAL